MRLYSTWISDTKKIYKSNEKFICCRHKRILASWAINPGMRPKFSDFQSFFKSRVQEQVNMKKKITLYNIS